VNLSIANPGEGARLNFSATAGENLGLGITGLVLSPSSVTRVDFTLYKPDGTGLSSGHCYTNATECTVNLANVPVTGSCSVIVQPASGATGAMQVWMSHDVSGTLVVGAPTSVALARPGQNARLTFAGTAGQTLRLNWSGVAITGAAGNVSGSVINPSGVTVAVLQFANGVAGGYDIPALLATGSYTVFIDPPVGATMNATLTLTAR